MGCFFPRQFGRHRGFVFRTRHRVVRRLPGRLGKRFAVGGIVAARRDFDDRHRLRQRLLQRHAGFVRGLTRIQAGEFARLRLGTASPPVGDRDPVIVGVNLAESEKAVPVAAVFYKGCLQRRLDSRNFCEIDIALYLLFGGGFEIEFFETIAVDDHHPRLFGMGGVDKHALCHSGVAPGRAPAAARNSAGGAIPCARKPATPDLLPGYDCVSAMAILVRDGFGFLKSAAPGAFARHSSDVPPARGPILATLPGAAPGRRSAAVFANINVYSVLRRDNAFVRTGRRHQPQPHRAEAAKLSWKNRSADAYKALPAGSEGSRPAVAAGAAASCRVE